MHVGGRYTQNGFDATPDEEIDDAALRKNKKNTDGKKNKNSEVIGNLRSFPQRSRDNETVRMYLKGRQRGNVLWLKLFETMIGKTHMANLNIY